MSPRPLIGLLAAFAVASCGARANQPGNAATAPSGKPSGAQNVAAAGAKPVSGARPGAKHAAAAKKSDPVFPDRPVGWKTVKTRRERKAIDAFATDYARFLGVAKTARRTVAELRRRFGPAAKALPLARIGTVAAGTRFVMMGPGSKAAAFIRVGKRPIEEGARIIVAAVDAPHIDLKQQPLYDKAGFAMFDTALYGHLELKSWLVQPLALYIHVSRPGAADGDADIVVGEAKTDPVLVIPDLLPHLSRRVQRRRVVDKAERMDAVAARTRRGLVNFLHTQGVDAKLFATAEVSLVPAGVPSFIGVDRGLLAGYGHSHRAMAFAAVRAIAGDEAPYRTAVVIVVNKSEIGSTGSSGLGFVRIVLNRVVAALATEDADVLTTRRFFARSAALIADRHGGARNKGLVINPHGDDALPRATRKVIDVLSAAKAQFQIASTANWGSEARRLGQLDMDAIDVGIPTTGHGAPRELLSVFDLHHAYRACTAWLVKR